MVGGQCLMPVGRFKLSPLSKLSRLYSTLKHKLDKNYLIVHLDDLFFYHWLFVLISVWASFQQRDGQRYTRYKYNLEIAVFVMKMEQEKKS